MPTSEMEPIAKILVVALVAVFAWGVLGWVSAHGQERRARAAEAQLEALATVPTGMFFLERPSLGGLDEWIAANEDDSPGAVHLVRALRLMGAERHPMTGLGMIDLAPVRSEDVFELARLGILREATPQECRNAGAERWFAEIDELPSDPDEEDHVGE